MEIYEVTPKFYTLDEVKEQANSLIKEAKELLKTPSKAKDGKEVLEGAISALENLVKSSTDRHAITDGMDTLRAAMEYYRSGNSTGNGNNENGGNGSGDKNDSTVETPSTGVNESIVLFASILVISAGAFVYLNRKNSREKA